MEVEIWDQSRLVIQRWYDYILLQPYQLTSTIEYVILTMLVSMWFLFSLQILFMHLCPGDVLKYSSDLLSFLWSTTKKPKSNTALTKMLAVTFVGPCRCSVTCGFNTSEVEPLFIVPLRVSLAYTFNLERGIHVRNSERNFLLYVITKRL